MKCENCRRKNRLIISLATRIRLSRLDRDEPLLEIAVTEAKKPPDVLLTDIKKSSSPSSA